MSGSMSGAARVQSSRLAMQPPSGMIARCLLRNSSSMRQMLMGPVCSAWPDCGSCSRGPQTHSRSSRSTQSTCQPWSSSSPMMTRGSNRLRICSELASNARGMRSGRPGPSRTSASETAPRGRASTPSRRTSRSSRRTVRMASALRLSKNCSSRSMVTCALFRRLRRWPRSRASTSQRFLRKASSLAMKLASRSSRSLSAPSRTSTREHWRI
mmetsp:Transcript_5843/g.14444  ORF Transcript_5843/g.14444 Transcript_5843/m.14444 type:complete len:212 (-) Transcript_5843:277-912(-)